MIIDKVVLTNFGTYRGEQTFDLTPKKSKPLILIGGLNGTGKTSLLNGIQIVLFGKRARVLGKANGSYSSQLASYMHWDTQFEENTSVSLEFRASQNGEEEKLAIRRSWAVNANGAAKEKFVVLRNGEKDQILSENWDEYVEKLIPVSISHLFFFDGERVEQYAKSGKSKELLKTGVHALLGVDLVERLQNDIRTLMREKSYEAKKNTELAEIAKSERELEQLEEQYKELDQEHRDQVNDKLGLEEELKKVEQRLSDAGVELFYQKVDLKKAHDAEKSHAKHLDKELVEIAAGALPLALVGDLLDEVREQDQIEHEAMIGAEMLSSLQGRDQKLISLLNESGAGADVQKKVESFLQRDRARLDGQSQAKRYLDLTPKTRASLQSMDLTLVEEKKRALSLIEQKVESTGHVDALEAKLARVPKEESLADMLKVHDNLEKKMALSKKSVADLELKKGRSERAIEVLRSRLEKEVKKRRSLNVGRHEGERVVRFGQLALDNIVEFKTRLVEKALGAVEKAIEESLSVMLRKKGLVTKVRIDPTDYTLTLFGRKGSQVNPDDLSAGERQLLVLATLWGLAKASERPLPVIIDTPLGRLDSKHRANLVKNYFPNASHQVILLSTDEEIDKDIDEKLRKCRSQGYHLDYDPAQNATEIKPGYFWDS